MGLKQDHVAPLQNKVKENIQPIFRLSPGGEDWQAGSLYNAGPSDDACILEVPGLPVWVMPQLKLPGPDVMSQS